MFRKLNRDKEDTKKTQIQLTEMKTTICEKINTVNGMNGRLDIAEEKISKLEDIPMTTIHSKI